MKLRSPKFQIEFPRNILGHRLCLQAHQFVFLLSQLHTVSITAPTLLFQAGLSKWMVEVTISRLLGIGLLSGYRTLS